jgi:hypothetical protein
MAKRGPKPKPKAPPKPNGRPPSYTRELSDFILSLHASGISIADISRRNDTVSESTIHNWRISNIDGFHERYAHAREIWLETLHERALEIAFMPPRMIDQKSLNGAPVEGTGRIDPAFEQWRKTQLDQLKWTMAKGNPAKFGDKYVVEQKVAISAERMSQDQLHAIAARKGLVIDGFSTPVKLPALEAGLDEETDAD